MRYFPWYFLDFFCISFYNLYVRHTFIYATHIADPKSGILLPGLGLLTVLGESDEG